MKHKIVYLPLDERPCNYSFPSRIAESASEIELIKPPLEIMGKKKQPASAEAISDFLLKNCVGAEACILSLDTLIYGGLLPSRLHNLSQEELIKRLDLIEQIKTINPEIKIYAFALIMRCPSYSSSDEEPEYYEYCGREIFLTGQVKHKSELNLISREEADKLLSEYSKKTKNYINDYENRRNANLAMLTEIISKAEDKIDLLVIPQDDSSPYGYTTSDREKLKAIIKQRGFKNIAMYPGADEVGLTLLARAVCDIHNISPSIKCIYAAEGAKNIIPLYEDRPLKDTLSYQIETAGCIQTEGEADIYLFLNYPSNAMVEASQTNSYGYGERDMIKFCGDIAQTVKNGKLAAIADGAYCNGGDVEFVKMLSKQISLFSLASYAGWNTSSNTLGTTICQAVFTLLYGKNKAHNKFLAERFYEDIGYCAHTRGYVCEKVLPEIGYGYFDAGEPEGKVAEIVGEEIQKYIDGNLPEVATKYRIAKCRMPWARMFEVDINCQEQ